MQSEEQANPGRDTHELPARFASIDPLELAARVTGSARIIFQRFDLESRRLVRSVVPLRLSRLQGATLEAVLRSELVGPPLFFFAGLQALVDLRSRCGPDSRISRLHRYLEIDHDAGSATVHDDAGTPAEELVAEIDRLVASDRPRPAAPVTSPDMAWVADADEARHAGQVEMIRRQIEAGAVKGVNLSIGLSRSTDADPFDVYQACVEANPSPYGFVLCDEQLSLIGSSPLAYLQLEDNELYLETDAGTRPVGPDAGANDQAASDLLTNPKDAAEHQVVVDAELAALRPIADERGIETVVSRQVRRFSHVMHLYSAFCARLRVEVDAVDAIQALSPAAAVSGYPKQAALALSREIEGTDRGPYGGVIGLVHSLSQADLAVVIRSVWIERSIATLRVGGKVVADSVAHQEYTEALSKSRFLVAALEAAEARTGAVAG